MFDKRDEYKRLMEGTTPSRFKAPPVQKVGEDKTTKDTNPKDAVGVRKVPFHVVPARVTAEVGLALLEGGRKYGTYNWRAAGVRTSVYIDATHRHLADFWEGVDTDPDSGLSHVTKAIASLVVLRDSMMQGNWTDDRPIRAAEGWVQEMNAKAAEIIDRYPDAKAPYTQRDNVRISS